MARSRILGLVVFAALVPSLPTSAPGQTPGGSPPASRAPAPVDTKTPLTVTTEPRNAFITFSGWSGITGRTPIDVPSSITGRYKIVVYGAGFSKADGEIFIPLRSANPYVASVGPGISAGLLLRGFNYPGVPDIASGHPARGVTLAIAGTGAIAMAGASHFTYRKRLDDVGIRAVDHATEAKRSRDSWAVYGAAVLGVSALDYWIQSRIGLKEATPTRMLLDAPKVSRGGAIWRSLLVPGAGQEFGNHRARGVVWLGAVLLSGGGIVLANDRVHRDENDLKWAEIDLSNAAPSEQAQKQMQADEARRSLQASNDVRRGFITATLSLHALNLLDSMVMPLTVPVATSPKTSFVAPLLGPGTAGMAVTLRF